MTVSPSPSLLLWFRRISLADVIVRAACQFILEDEGHDYCYSKRVSTYKFLAKHLGISMDRILNAEGFIDASTVVIEDEKTMHVFNAGHPRAAHTVTSIEWVR